MTLHSDTLIVIPDGTAIKIQLALYYPECQIAKLELIVGMLLVHQECHVPGADQQSPRCEHEDRRQVREKQRRHSSPMYWLSFFAREAQVRQDHSCGRDHGAEHHPPDPNDRTDLF